MPNTAKIAFQTKLMFGILGAVTATILLMTAVTLYQVNSSLEFLGKTSLKSFADTVYATMEMQNKLLGDKVRTDLSIFQSEFTRAGILAVNPGNSSTLEITNQITKQKESASLPQLTLGGKPLLNNYDLVDAVQKKVGGAATIFQVLPGKLLRISTNVKKADGGRAVGTYIPDSSPVYQAVMKGETYTGVAFVVNAWFQTAYSPLKDSTGEIVAVLFVGRPIITPEFKATIQSSAVGGKGYGFIFHEDGTLLVHPKIEGESIKEASFWKGFSEAVDNQLEYEFQGEDKVVYLKKFAPWKMSYGFSMNASDMSHGVDKKLALIFAVLAIVAIGFTAAIIWILVRVVVKPLKDLSSFTQKVSQGDYSAAIDYAAQDAIGQTITSVQGMVADLKNKLGFSEGVLKGFAAPCAIADQNNKMVFINTQMLAALERDGRPEDYYGQTSGQFFWGEAARETLSQRALREKRTLTDERERNTFKGNKRFFSVTSTPFSDIDGQLLGTLAVWFDLTEIRLQQALIKEQNAKIAATALEADTIAQQLSAAADELLAQADQVRNGSDVQQQRTAETATAMEEMNATVMEVAKNASAAAQFAEETKGNAQNGATLVSKVVAAIDQVQRLAEGLKNSMDELAGQADSIGKIIQVIDDIADQTNLLALNAAIEAARAGDAGRGFAVVADEVRKLAEKTMTATREVGTAVRAIQEGTKKNTESTNEAAQAVSESTGLAAQSGQALQIIVSMADQTAEQVRSIATAAEEQSATSEEINRSTEQINTISSEISQAMSEASRAIHDLAKLAVSLKELIKNMRG